MLSQFTEMLDERSNLTYILVCASLNFDHIKNQTHKKNYILLLCTSRYKSCFRRLTLFQLNGLVKCIISFRINLTCTVHRFKHFKSVIKICVYTGQDKILIHPLKLWLHNRTSWNCDLNSSTELKVSENNNVSKRRLNQFGQFNLTFSESLLIRFTSTSKTKILFEKSFGSFQSKLLLM